MLIVAQIFYISISRGEFHGTFYINDALRITFYNKYLDCIQIFKIPREKN